MTFNKEFLIDVNLNGGKKSAKVSFNLSEDETGQDVIKQIKVYVNNQVLKKYPTAEVISAIMMFLDTTK
jgi:hypothetical protein